MKAVFLHELSSGFKGLTCYVFGAFLLLFAGIYTVVYNVSYAVASFEYVLSGMSFVFLIAVPVLTMRVLAEERRQKTDQLLYSLPLSMTDVVMGKYAALLCMFLLPVAVISIYPLILSAYGAMNMAAAYSALLGFAFLGAALIAVGVFISSAVESQTVSALLCFLVLLVNYFLASLSSLASTSAVASFCAFTLAVVVLALIIWLMTKNYTMAGLAGLVMETVLVALYAFSKDSFESLFPTILEKLSLFERFESYVNGVFDLTSLVFYVTVAGVFLFLSVQSLEKRRWS